MKKVIIILAIILLVIGIKAKAIELGQPQSPRLYVLDDPADTTGPGMWVINNQPQETLFLHIDQTEEDRFYKSIQYNDNMRTVQLDWNWNFNNIQGENQIIQFYVAYDTKDIGGDGLAKQINTIHTYNEDGTQTQCGVVGRIGDYRNYHSVFVANVKCIVNKKATGITVKFINTGNDNTDQRFYVSYNSTQRSPVSNEELIEVQEEIKTGIETQTQIIGNMFTTGYDNVLPSSNFYEYMVQQENRLMENIENMNDNMLATEIDTNANTIIWTWANRFINIDNKILTMYMIILSLGIVKLILGR